MRLSDKSGTRLTGRGIAEIRFFVLGALALAAVLTLLAVTPGLAAPHHQGVLHKPFISDVR